MKPTRFLSFLGNLMCVYRTFAEAMVFEHFSYYSLEYVCACENVASAFDYNKQQTHTFIACLEYQERKMNKRELDESTREF